MKPQDIETRLHSLETEIRDMKPSQRSITDSLKLYTYTGIAGKAYGENKYLVFRLSTNTSQAVVKQAPTQAPTQTIFPTGITHPNNMIHVWMLPVWMADVSYNITSTQPGAVSVETSVPE